MANIKVVDVLHLISEWMQLLFRWWNTLTPTHSDFMSLSNTALTSNSQSIMPVITMISKHNWDVLTWFAPSVNCIWKGNKINVDSAWDGEKKSMAWIWEKKTCIRYSQITERALSSPCESSLNTLSCGSIVKSHNLSEPQLSHTFTCRITKIP